MPLTDDEQQELDELRDDVNRLESRIEELEDRDTMTADDVRSEISDALRSMSIEVVPEW